jgi:hypothetical protein
MVPVRTVVPVANGSRGRCVRKTKRRNLFPPHLLTCGSLRLTAFVTSDPSVVLAFVPLSTLPSLHPLWTKDPERSVVSMSSTVQATSSTSSTSNTKLITDALVTYAKITGVDLSKNPFAAAIERANSPGDILELLQERERALKDYREGNGRLISCLSPAVNVIQAFSGVLGSAVSLVSLTSHLVTLLT